MEKPLPIIKSLDDEFPAGSPGETYVVDLDLRLLRRASDDKPIAVLELPPAELKELLGLI